MIYYESAARICQNLYLDYRYVKIFIYEKNCTTHYSNFYNQKALFYVTILPPE